MRNLIPALAFVCWVMMGCAQPGTTRMFRDNSEHNSYKQTSYDLVYDTKAWAFDAGSPIRATPLVQNGTVYFGTAKGDFFALHSKSSAIKWHFSTGKAIHSSAASWDKKIYFSDNGQTLYCLQENNGKLAWKFDMGEKIPYPWRFDYYYSSPVIAGNKLYIGGDDGYLYSLDPKSGKLDWKYKCKGLVRSTPAVYKGLVLFGDNDGIFYALDNRSGTLKWSFKVKCEPLNLDTIGFDRKAILGAPVVANDKVIFGARDGLLYCLDVNDGKVSWTVDHHVSWIISTVAVKDSFVVTGTSDGKFVQAVNLNTGKEIWKYNTPQPDWCSPLINNDRVYEGCFDGQLFCLDLKTGKRISQFATGGIIFSGPVLEDSLLYFGSDDGFLYSLKGHAPIVSNRQNKYVYYDQQVPKIYFRTGGDVLLRNYLRGNGFKVINTDTLLDILSKPADQGVIVFASDLFTRKMIEGGKNSLLRRYLDAGGRVVVPGNNSLFFSVDETGGQEIMGLAKNQVDTVLDLHFGKPDTRGVGGLFPGFANEKGKMFGLPAYWVSNFGIDKKQVDIVLGENENGQASAFVKKYAKGGEFVQVWINASLPVSLDGILKVSEWPFLN